VDRSNCTVGRKRSGRRSRRITSSGALAQNPKLGIVLVLVLVVVLETMGFCAEKED
jgi:hypothetical protein